MRRIAVLFGIVGSCTFSVTARGAPVLFTDEAAFLEAVGEIQEIDFETLPDGSPSYSGAFITPEFNYTAQGVNFFSYASDLFIAGSPGGFGLQAGPYEQSTGPRTWLIADPVEPALAVGFDLPGSSTLRVYSLDDTLIFDHLLPGSGVNFFGVQSFEDPISRIELDRGGFFETITAFGFAPVPEPATLVLLLAGGPVVMFHIRRARLLPERGTRSIERVLRD